MGTGVGEAMAIVIAPILVPQWFHGRTDHHVTSGRPWSSDLWETSDDRVRGGSSQSSLVVINPERARFAGHLDTKTLGGAGFASQHSVGELSLNLSDYDGILLSIVKADRKRYALTLKNSLPPNRPDGRERAAVSWEADFVAPEDADGDLSDGPANLFLPWSAFKATYRGKDKPDAEPLDLANIKRVGLMMRSFFGEQDGDFSLDLHGIAARRSLHDAVAAEPRPATTENHNQAFEEDNEGDDEEDLHKDSVLPQAAAQQPSQAGDWWRRLLCGLV
ncbi:hypothetical protein S7711_03259 [Stachybotrys chartarum IBT 7711]|uniref:NADH:ubiquinone oxidoreductase intermediate-associated protein 30 domain-containing protein n=1 Tax=Stachybotrys chartarum (strain CBS 109288 / IBT 7711) TaxID=1280523 RepID=A0A084AZN4_STACB|nr:hypothetical protein S7711_03259 [Stachybotrys chartarum IBT 7711]